MRIPTIRGMIDRRVLVNFRIDPQVLAKLLPPPFRPQLVSGYGIAGICLIRLKYVRPSYLPALFGISSENAAHRIAVEWDEDRTTKSGVYIPRRDTSSRLNAIVGGRLFPGVHHRAVFDVREANDQLFIEMRSVGGSERLLVEGTASDRLPEGSIFASLDDVSQFFEKGSLGYSPRRTRGQYDGLELRCRDWRVNPLKVSRVESSFFDNREMFPTGSIMFDNALLMRHIDHDWHGREPLCCTQPVAREIATGAAGEASTS